MRKPLSTDHVTQSIIAAAAVLHGYEIRSK